METLYPTAHRRTSHPRISAIAIALLLLAPPLHAAFIWVEGEQPIKATMARHPWWYDKVKKDQLSGGDFISNWSPDKIGEAVYAVESPEAREYEFWVRANPVRTRLSYRIDGAGWNLIDMSGAIDTVNIADDDKIDVRYLAWTKVGKVTLKKGHNFVGFRMDSENNHHGMLDCFIFSTTPFEPHGAQRPDQAAPASADQEKGWFAFGPKADQFEASAALDLRSLNESQAGDGGFIAAKGEQFVHSRTGEPVRFWAVNMGAGELKDPDLLRNCARILAKHGVNLVRLHGGYFDETGNVDPAKVHHAIEIVRAMKTEGIYCHFSTYFPLWLRPKPDNAWLPGYDGNKNPFAALYFNQDFQKQYQSWWKALLLTPDEKTGARLVNEPAVFGAEIINEDSYFFWTFNPELIPDAELRIVEKQFGDWLDKQYGSIAEAKKSWAGVKVDRDDPANGRMGFRPLWNMVNQKTQRDKDTARFLLESQREFYDQTHAFLRGIGFKGVICASNWATASQELLGPLERYSYTGCDFIDRHGYFGCDCHGPDAGWSIRDGYTYADRSALRFDPEEPGKPKWFVNPVMDIHYDGEPSMISETTFSRPNRYRSEAPLYYAAYGALQDSGAIVHFVLDSSRWSVKPGYFMQPWTLMTPAMMGQFPAAALIFRQQLVSPGDLLVDLNLKLKDLENFSGTPMPQDAAFDELRLKDVPQGTEMKPGNVIDPLVHYAGRTNVRFTDTGGASRLENLSSWIDHSAQTVTSTNHQLHLDYGKGLLTINTPSAQGASGNLHDAGEITLKNLTIHSEMPLGHIIAVSLDGKPLASSAKILLQVMSEEMATGFRTEPSGSVNRIVSIGHDPWLVKEISATVQLMRPDAASMKVEALDFNGYAVKPIGTAEKITLLPDALYYLISR